MRLVLATVGSRGDVQPMLALALHAQACGHEVLLAAPPDFGDWIRARGVPFAPLGQDIQAFLAANPDAMTSDSRQMLAIVTRYFAQEVPRQVGQLLMLLEGADAAVWAGLAASTALVARSKAIPAMGVLYSTCVLPSAAHPPPTMPLYGAPRWANRLLWWLDQQVVQRTVARPFHDARVALGLPPMPFRDFLLTSSHFAIAVDEDLFPRPADWHFTTTQASFIFHDDPRELDASLLEWLDAGEPPVFAGFGSMSGPGPQRAAAAFVQAMRASGRRGLVGSGWAGLGRDLPAGWRVVGDVSHAKLFPRLAAVVHHGGSGTTATALRAGVPQVILPLFLDQHHHAHGLHRAGLAPRPVRMERVTSDQLQSMLDQAFKLDAAPRDAVARRLQGRDACGEIVDRLEALAR